MYSKLNQSRHHNSTIRLIFPGFEMKIEIETLARQQSGGRGPGDAGGTRRGRLTGADCGAEGGGGPRSIGHSYFGFRRRSSARGSFCTRMCFVQLLFPLSGACIQYNFMVREIEILHKGQAQKWITYCYTKL